MSLLQLGDDRDDPPEFFFLAHRIDGYGYAEIAHRTGLSIKTVEKHMSRAIAALDRINCP